MEKTQHNLDISPEGIAEQANTIAKILETDLGTLSRWSEDSFAEVIPQEAEELRRSHSELLESKYGITTHRIVPAYDIHFLSSMDETSQQKCIRLAMKACADARKDYLTTKAVFDFLEKMFTIHADTDKEAAGDPDTDEHRSII